jgi:hypothetical protein
MIMNHQDVSQVLAGPLEVDLRRITEALMGLVRYQRMTKKEIVRQHQQEIEDAARRGVSYAEVARVLSTLGCPLSPRLLRKYLSDIRKNLPPQSATPLIAEPLASSLPPTPRPIDVSQTPPVTSTRHRSLRRSALLPMNKESTNDQ